MQALDRALQPGLPMKRGGPGQMTHDYIRNGTTTLFAALNALDGSVIGQCMARHRHQEFIRFLNRIEAAVPAGKADPRDPRQLRRPQVISAVPQPSAVARIIRARQTCFCRLLPSVTTADNRSRSAALTSTLIPSRIAHYRIRRANLESYDCVVPLEGKPRLRA